MNAFFQLFTENVIDSPLAGDAGQALKARADNQQAEVRLSPLPRPGMAGVKVRFVLHFEDLRRKGRPDARLNPFRNFQGIYPVNHNILAASPVLPLLSRLYQPGTRTIIPPMTYSYRPRHGYDIRVKPPREGAEPPVWARQNTRLCDREGCEKKAAVRASKSPRETQAKVWLCEEHARAHNAQWNFFDGLSETEAEAARLANIYGDRPTWKMGKNERARSSARARGPADLRDAFGIFSEAVKTAQAHAPLRNGRPVSKLQEKAFATLELSVSAEAGEIRRRYAELLRRFHPDANGGDRSAETQLQEVVRAHHILKKAGFC